MKNNAIEVDEYKIAILGDNIKLKLLHYKWRAIIDLFQRFEIIKQDENAENSVERGKGVRKEGRG